MEWNDKLQADFSLSRNARRVAAVLADTFALANVRYAAAYESEIAGLLDIGIDAARAGIHELLRRGYIVKLVGARGNGRPAYALRLGHQADADEEVA